MKNQKSILGVVIMLGLGWIVLSATNSLEKLKYTPLIEIKDENGKVINDDISVRNNETFSVKLPESISFPVIFSI